MSDSNSGQADFFTEATWRQVALLAYVGYAAKGRGVVVVDRQKLRAGLPSGSYVPVSEMVSLEWSVSEVEQITQQYDPETQVLVAGLAEDKRVLSLMTAEDHLTPRKIYDEFFAKMGPRSNGRGN